MMSIDSIDTNGSEGTEDAPHDPGVFTRNSQCVAPKCGAKSGAISTICPFIITFLFFSHNFIFLTCTFTFYHKM